jgi:hypothetical protein
VVLDRDGHVPRGLRLGGKRELVEVLGGWLRYSGASQIGEVGTFGGRPWLRVAVGGVVLNADTKRVAVEVLVREKFSEPDRPWRVVANRGGGSARVLPGPGPELLPGWCAYLTRPRATPGVIWASKLVG